MSTSQTRDADSGAVRVESDRDSPMTVVVLKDGSRALFASEDDEWAIAAANPGCDTWTPTWHAFDVMGPRLDFSGIEATLEAAIEARRQMPERKPVVQDCCEPETRTVAWWDEQAARSGIRRPRFRGPARGRFPCLCAQLVDRGDGIAFATMCITDTRARLVAERGCRILGTAPGKEVWERACSRTADAINRIIEDGPDSASMFANWELGREVMQALSPKVREAVTAAQRPNPR